MCGLFAIINTDKTPSNKETLSKALYSLAHRGPDHSQQWISNHIALGHHRLSIIDTSKKAHQPLLYRSLRIIFNGAIYNHVELRAELQTLGHTFLTSSDTEVICAAYLEWGAQCLDRFNGMWSFVIYDERDDTVFVSRDRFGIKPLYYLSINGNYYFSSEVKAFLAIPEYKPKLNHSLAKRFLFNGKTQFNQESFFEQISVFPQGSYGTLKNGAFNVEKYYLIEKKYYEPSDFRSSKEQLRSLLTDSIKLRLRSDVQLGYSQSGGLDSNSIIALSKNLTADSKLLTYSVCFNEFPDENSLIDLATRYNNATNYQISPNTINLLTELRSLTWYQDQPVASASVLAQNQLYKLVNETKPESKVILGGQGADEICYGYDAFIKQALRNNPLSFIRSPLFYSQLIYGFFIKDDQQIKLKGENFSREEFPKNPRGLAKKMLTESVLPELLHYEDRNAMQYGIESRLPFLDYRLVEFCLSCPPSYFNRNGNRKMLLRESMNGLIPEPILHRRKKNAFFAPMSQWLKSNRKEISAFLEERFYLLEDFIEKDTLSKLSMESSAMWRVLNLVIFRERFDV